MKILYVLTVGTTCRFFTDLIKKLIDEGHTVDFACNKPEDVYDCYREWGCEVFEISCSRNPLKAGNIKAIKEIEKIVKQGGYDIVHCHTPIAAACTRLACKKFRKNGLKVFYTAHGFHFYKGAPKKNWLIYYPIEKLCAHFTDVLITINKEDFELASKKLKAKSVEYVPGVGLNIEKFSNVEVDKTLKRQSLSVPEDAFLLLSVGELNQNKNHEVIIRALAELNDSNIYYIIAGRGRNEQYLNHLIENLKLNNNVKLLGRRSDVPELCAISDAFCFPSIREGLSVSLMEAQASGIPCVVSKIRGNTDIIENCVNGFTVPPCDIEGFASAIKEIKQNSDIGDAMKKFSAENIKKFGLDNVLNRMFEIYFEKSTEKSALKDKSTV